MKWTWRASSKVLPAGTREFSLAPFSPTQRPVEIRDPLTQCWRGPGRTQRLTRSRASPGPQSGLGSPRPWGRAHPTDPRTKGRALEPQSAQVHEPGEVEGAGMKEKMSSSGMCTGDQAHGTAQTLPQSPPHTSGNKKNKTNSKHLFLG